MRRLVRIMLWENREHGSRCGGSFAGAGSLGSGRYAGPLKAVLHA